MFVVPAQLLPEGFALPSLPYLLALSAATVAVGVALRRREPRLTPRRGLALVPWMVAGAVAHVAHVVGVAPGVVDPLLGTPAVYVSAAVLAGATWLGANVTERLVAPALTVIGSLLALTSLTGVGAAALAAGTLAPTWPLAALVGGIALGVVAWAVLRRVHPAASVAGRLGALALIAHAVDGVTTAVGVDVLGYAERTPASRFVLEFAAGLPTAPVLGAGWLFVLFKLAVAAVVVVAVADTVREAPTEGRLLLVLVAAVGLGPGVHNAVLFAVS
ncbi:MAG: DUF63 family protein [Halolamina sp.]